MSKLLHFSKISDYHRFANLPAPEHPLISLVDYSKVSYPAEKNGLKLIANYYTIGLKRNVPYKFYYGQQEYDFDEGLMTFVSPNQVIRMEDNPNIGTGQPSGYLLLIHQDFLWKTALAGRMLKYDFFGYAIHESLFLSAKEEQTITEIMLQIEKEYQANIDKFSHNIIISQLELILNYAERFYERQFITRNKSGHQVLEKLEALLADCFHQGSDQEFQLPSVEFVAEKLNLSANYLSSLLKSLTGLSTQQHIHQKLIEKAKEQLSTTVLSVSEIAYSLGFEQPASFTRLFKSKTEMSPLEFRKRFN